MTEGQIRENGVVVDRELLEKMLESTERIFDGVSLIAGALSTMKDQAPPAPASAEPPAVVEPREWNLSDDALINYDGDALIALREDFRAGRIKDDDGRVKATLERRLGSL